MYVFELGGVCVAGVLKEHHAVTIETWAFEVFCPPFTAGSALFSPLPLSLSLTSFSCIKKKNISLWRLKLIPSQTRRYFWLRSKLEPWLCAVLCLTSLCRKNIGHLCVKRCVGKPAEMVACVCSHSSHCVWLKSCFQFRTDNGACLWVWMWVQVQTRIFRTFSKEEKKWGEKEVIEKKRMGW